MPPAVTIRGSRRPPSVPHLTCTAHLGNISQPKRVLQPWCRTPPHFWSEVCSATFFPPSFFYFFCLDDWLWIKNKWTPLIPIWHRAPMKKQTTTMADLQLQKVTVAQTFFFFKHSSTRRRRNFLTQNSLLAELKDFSTCIWKCHTNVASKVSLSEFFFFFHLKHMQKHQDFLLARRGAIKRILMKKKITHAKNKAWNIQN